MELFTSALLVVVMVVASIACLSFGAFFLKLGGLADDGGRTKAKGVILLILAVLAAAEALAGLARLLSRSPS